MKHSTWRLWLVVAVALVGCAPVEQRVDPPTLTPPPRATLTHTAVTKATAIPTATAPPVTPTQAAPDPPGPIAGVVPAAFAPYQAVPVSVRPSVAAYSLDPDQVINPNMLRALNSEQRDHLAQHGFVAVPDGPDQIYALYRRAKQAGIPVIVTTDAMLHTFHVLYDYTLRSVEIDHLVDDLRALNQAVLDAAVETWEAASEPDSREAAMGLVAFSAVASRLLDPQATIPDAVEELVTKELALIDAHQGTNVSPVMGTEEDYSQYVPRGHYTRNETFQRFFRCMMWYGRIGFHPTTRAVDRARKETRQALMMTAALYGTPIGAERAIDVWERIYEPTSFFVGQADDLTPQDYWRLAEFLFSAPIDSRLWGNTERLDDFREATRTLKPPRIVGGLVDDTQNVVDETRSFRFMGQRFVYDSYLFQQLVYDQIGAYQGTGTPLTLSGSDGGPIRGVPRGLDIAAAFGSDRALEILRREGDAQYAGYEEQLALLRAETAALPHAQWVENLYWGWMYSLRALLVPSDEGYPAFMQDPAWTDKNLQAFLGSWTELRHDTILYAKQSYTVRATSIEIPPQPTQGYVEPQPELYARLAALARQMRIGLSDRGLLNFEFSAKLGELEDVLLQLVAISEKELSGQVVSEDEYALIGDMGATLERLTTFSEQTDEGLSSPTDDRMPIVADVHTDVNTMEVLEEGVGNAFTLYAIVPAGAAKEGATQAVMGGVFSHYEFRQPMSDRLTDEAWQNMPRPALAPWTSSFVVP